MKQFLFLFIILDVYCIDNFKFDDSAGYEPYSVLDDRYSRVVKDINAIWSETMGENSIAVKQMIGRSYLGKQMFSVSLGKCMDSSPSVLIKMCLYHFSLS